MKKIALGTLVMLLALWIVLPTTGFSTAEFSKKEGNAPCTKCHTAVPKKGDEDKKLNDVGKCYDKQEKDKKDLKACEKK